MTDKFIEDVIINIINAPFQYRVTLDDICNCICDDIYEQNGYDGDYPTLTNEEVSRIKHIIDESTKIGQFTEIFYYIKRGDKLMQITYDVVKEAIELYADMFDDLPTERDIRIVIEEKMNSSIPLTGAEIHNISNIILEETAPRGRFFEHVETSYGVKSDCDMEI